MQTSEIITANQSLQEENLLYDTGSERALLALVIRWPHLIVECERLVPPDAMFRQANKYVYRCMLYSYREAVKNNWELCFNDVAMLSVAQFLGRQDRFLQETRNLQHVRELMAMGQNLQQEQFSQMVAAVRDAATRVQGYREFRVGQLAMINRPENPDAMGVVLTAEARLTLMSQAQHADTDSCMTRLADEEQSLRFKINLAVKLQDSRLFAVPCHRFPRWSYLMGGGFRRKGLTVIAARPKVGKSTLLQSIAQACAVESQIPVLYLDTEMSREEIYSRALAAESQVPELAILKGVHVGSDQARVAVDDGMTRLRQAPLYYANVANKPVHYAISLIRQFRKQHVETKTYHDDRGNRFDLAGQGVVIYDWLRLPDPGMLKDAQEYQALGFLASALKNAGREVDLPVIAGAQGNRGAIPMLARDFANMGEAVVAGSDRLAQFCTQLCILRNVREEAEYIANHQAWKGCRTVDEYEDPRNGLFFNQVLHVTLQRSGADHREGIPLYLHRGTQRYQEMSVVWGQVWDEKNQVWKPGWQKTGAEAYLREIAFAAIEEKKAAQKKKNARPATAPTGFPEKAASSVGGPSL